MLKEATCFYHNGCPHTIICADLLNKNYWCAYVSYYDMHYYWLDMTLVESIVSRRNKND